MHSVFPGDAITSRSSGNPHGLDSTGRRIPVKEVIQQDGRIHRWAPIQETEGRYVRVILLPDRETIHNVFFDRGFMP
jgi:hypothetical protein